MVALKDLSAPAHATGDPTPGVRDRLTAAIDHAAHLLPAQGPITVFIHHNTLHAFEHLPFEQAVQQGGAVFGCQPFLSEERYRAELLRGRIRFDGLRAVVRDDLGGRADEPMAGLVSRGELRLALLQHPTESGSAAELEYHLAEADAFRRVGADVPAAARGRLASETRRWVMRDLRGRAGGPPWATELLARRGAGGIEGWDADAWEAVAVESLWRACRHGVASVPPAAVADAVPVRHAPLLAAATDADPDLPVHDLLIRFCAAFLDQGVSNWPLPGRDEGFYRAFLQLYARPGVPPAASLAGLSAEAGRLLAAGVGPLDAVAESLALLGVGEGEWDEYLTQTLLALRGWGGIIRHVEERGDRVALPIPAGSLIEFVAVRLLLDRLAAARVAAAELRYTGPLTGLRAELRAMRVPAAGPTADQRAYPVFRLAQVFGWSPPELLRLTPGQWAELVGEVERFNGVDRRRVFHLAYERRFRTQCLDAVALHEPQPFPAAAAPRFQVVTCLDEREESFRRHLEEVAPACETFGLAGFYGVAMYYRGAATAHYVPLCPVVIRPRHWVEERPTAGPTNGHTRRAKARRAFGAVSHRVHVGTRSFAVGAVLSAGLGALAVVPLVARVLFPRLAAEVRRRLGRVVQPGGQTRLALERPADTEPGPTAPGFSVAEMTDIAHRQLGDAGLTTGRFARLVLTLGHGSHSMNNPHESAHDCGACGGSVGGANGRALAHMLNDPRVRVGLAARGLVVPDDTVFVGGLHNTCNEYVKFADTDRVPATHLDLFHEAKAAIEVALARNAHERARRFGSAPLALTPEAARRHMDARAEDLAQVRPEWGHATNALCVVGRRERTRGLYLDRRAFLTSYDPTQDGPDAPILARILAAAVPVCAGINLEYYFCHTDPSGYGCGTKLPHNITSLLGVMDGAASDLRTGLPWQMVEIHEPVRLLFIIETTPERMLGIMAGNPTIDVLVRNGWVQLATLAPDSAAVHLYRDGRFEPVTTQADGLPAAPTSIDWYRGWRDHLEFAEITGGVG